MEDCLDIQTILVFLTLSEETTHRDCLDIQTVLSVQNKRPCSGSSPLATLRNSSRRYASTSG